MNSGAIGFWIDVIIKRNNKTEVLWVPLTLGHLKNQCLLPSFQDVF